MNPTRSPILLRGFLLLLLAASTCPSAGAQAWTQPQGHVYGKLSYGTATASQQYGFDGRVKPYADNVEDDAFFDRSIYLYTEIGFTDDLTAVFTVPYKRVFIRDAAFKYRTVGFGGLTAGLRMSLADMIGWANTRNAISTNILVSAPLGYTRNLAPSTGAGQVDLLANLSYGRSLYPLPMYAQIAAGYRYRSDWYALSSATACGASDITCVQDLRPDFDDEIIYTIESGASAGAMFLQAIVMGVWSIRAPTTGFTVTNPLPTRQRYVKVGGGVALVEPKNFAVGAQIFFTPSGQNTVRSIDLFISLEFRFPGGA